MSSPALYPKFRAYDPSTGLPLVGGKLYTYVAGTTTPLATYADSGLGTANANPIILDGNGEAVIYVGPSAYKFVLQKSDGTAVWTFDNYSPNVAFNDNTDPQWYRYAVVAPTYISTTSFSLNGADATSYFSVGRRMKSSNTGGIIYSTVVSSVYSLGNTTVTVVNDAGLLDSGIANVYYGIVQYANPSYLDPRSAVQVTKSGNQTGFASITQITTWNAATLDALSEFSSNRFNAKYPGLYLVTATVEVSDTAANTAVTLTLTKGGIAYAAILGVTAATGGVHNTQTITAIVSLTAAQTVEVNLTGTANTTVYATNTRMNVSRIV